MGTLYKAGAEKTNYEQNPCPNNKKNGRVTGVVYTLQTVQAEADSLRPPWSGLVREILKGRASPGQRFSGQNNMHMVGLCFFFYLCIQAGASRPQRGRLRLRV